MTATNLKELIEGDELTDQEILVLYGAAAGETSGETGNRMFLANETVKGYRKRVIAKLGARNLLNAVVIAIGSGILNIDRIMEPEE